MAKRNVVWTKTAAKQRREIFRYWTVRNGSTKYAEKLIKLIAVRIGVILEHPESYIRNIYRDTHFSAMGNYSILYKLTENQIIILAFWDNRQDPDKLLEIIKE